jgi:hypothetical protein
MLVTLLSNDLLEKPTDVKIHKLDTLEPDLLIQGDLSCTETGFLIYPKLTVKYKPQDKLYPLSAFVGKLSFRYAREFGNAENPGYGFSASMYSKGAPKNYLNVDCVVFGRLVDTFKKYGDNSTMLLQGGVSFEEYKGKTKVKMTVSGFSFAGGGKDESTTVAKTQAAPTAVNSEEIPF